MPFLLTMTRLGDEPTAHSLARTQVERRLRELHPYELPAIHSLWPEQAWPAFAEWVQRP